MKATQCNPLIRCINP